MSNIFLFLLFGLIVSIASEIDHLKERLQSSGEELSITELSKPPKASFYLNSLLTKNNPHKIDLLKELTKIITEWDPRVLASDPTCPYYFSMYNNLSSPDDDLNLLSYLQAIEANETLAYPFRNILPEPYRSGLVLLSIFQCEELLSEFYNIELIVGPGQTGLPLRQQSDHFSQFYCSLFGYPNFLLINQTTDFNIETLFLQDNLNEIQFLSTTLSPGTCLFTPSNWLISSQLNNSISLLLTLNKITKLTDNQDLLCTKTRETTLDNLHFTIQDTLNLTNFNLLIYFYQYLNPPLFNKEYSSDLFFQTFQNDKNISQLILHWTPELINLIQENLFQQIDINHDNIFNIEDYLDIKQSNLNQIEFFLNSIFETIHEIILIQYNQLNDIMKKIIKQKGNYQLDQTEQDLLEIMIENLPDSVKEKFKQHNIDIKDVLKIVKSQNVNQSYRTDL